MNHVNSAILAPDMGWFILVSFSGVFSALASSVFVKFSREEFDWQLLNEREPT